jgi:hypothetical protein
MGKPEAALKKKENFKSPISPFWLGEFLCDFSFTAGVGKEGRFCFCRGAKGMDREGAFGMVCTRVRVLFGVGMDLCWLQGGNWGDVKVTIADGEFI